MTTTFILTYTWNGSEYTQRLPPAVGERHARDMVLAMARAEGGHFKRFALVEHTEREVQL